MKDKMAKLIEITGRALSGEWGNDDNTGNGIPVLRTTNFTNEGIVNYNNVVTRIIEKKKIEEKYLRKGDIIIEKSGGSDKQPVGRVVYFDGPENTYLFNNFTGLLRVKDQAKWYPRYVFYSLFSNYHRGGTRAFQNKTTGLHNLKIDDFMSRCEVTEAGINEQIAACKQMDRVNDIIRMHQQQLQKLDELVKARFIELFGDQTANPYAWQQTSIGACCTLKSGTSLPADKENEGGAIPYVKVGDMNYPGNEQYITTSSRFVSEQTAGTGVFPVGTVVFPKRGGAIGTNKKRLTRLPICADLNVMGVTAGRRLTPQYLMAYFNTVDLGTLNNGSSVPQINNKDIAPLLICIPPMALQEQFAAFVEQTDKSKVVVQKALDEAQTLFDSLMQKYFQ